MNHIAPPSVRAHRYLIGLFLAVPPLLLSGCGTFMNDFSGGRDRAYGGVRWDLETLVAPSDKESLPCRPLLVVDLPLSFAFDTLALGELFYRDLNDGPSVDPLKDWKNVPPYWRNQEEKSLAENFPFEDAIRDDVVAHINQRASSYAWDREKLTLRSNYTYLSCHEDGQGNRAVRIGLPWESDSQDMRVITLLYDAQGKHTKSFTWRSFHRPSRC